MSSSQLQSTFTFLYNSQNPKDHNLQHFGPMPRFPAFWNLQLCQRYRELDQLDVHQLLWGRRIGNMKFDPIFLLLHCFRVGSEVDCLFDSEAVILIGYGFVGKIWLGTFAIGQRVV